MTPGNKNAIKESDLYLPVKTLLEAQGYTVKGEVGAADLVGVRGDDTKEEPVIVELKTGFTLALLHQAIERLKISDKVYVAVPHKAGRTNRKALVANKLLCRRLGIGLITVRPKDGFCQIHLDPAPYQPRKTKAKKEHLLKEFHARIGDPNIGGVNKTQIMTAYRQDALYCACLLAEQGATKASEIAKQTGIERARNIMADNHYGWFERVKTGIYALTPKGKKAAKEYGGDFGVASMKRAAQ